MVRKSRAPPMRLRVDVDTMNTVSSRGIALALREREDAHRKHGINSIEANTADPYTMLAILVEEVGEVAKCLTYDQDPNNLVLEVSQVMAVAWAWLDGLVSE
jgi:hypothetical protein